MRRPQDPRAFLVDLLSKLPARGAHLLSEENLATVFGLYDVVRRGVVPRSAAHRALASIRGRTAPSVKERASDGLDDQTMLSKDQFVAYLSSALGGGE